MGRYVGQNIPSVAHPPGVPPPRCEGPLVDADVESEDSSDSSDDDMAVTRILFVLGNVFFGLSGVFFLLFHGLS